MIVLHPIRSVLFLFIILFLTSFDQERSFFDNKPVDEGKEFCAVFDEIFEASKKDFGPIMLSGKKGMDEEYLLPDLGKAMIKEDEDKIRRYEGHYPMIHKKNKAVSFYKDLISKVEKCLSADFGYVDNPVGKEIKKRTFEYKAEKFAEVAKRPSCIIVLQKEKDGFLVSFVLKEPLL